MNINTKTTLIALSTLLAGLLLGWLFFGPSGNESTEEHQHTSMVDGESVWTCSMHPQIRQSEPGSCPICGMDLIPLEDEGDEMDAMAVKMSKTAMELASIRTAHISRQSARKHIRLNGKVQPDERLIYSQSSHIPGRIEKLMINFTGEYVHQGQPIAMVYAPELVTAQEELFEAEKIKSSQPQLFAAAREKLKNWKLTSKQIDDILNVGKPRELFTVLSDVTGYVTAKMVNLGDYVPRGKTLYEVVDLSRMWVLFDVYESELPWVKKGSTIEYELNAIPGRTFKGTIAYIDPVIDPQTRVVKARVEVPNKNQLLKPEMFVSGKLSSESSAEPSLTVPKTAVMWTGTRSVVYIKSSSGKGVSFVMREVTLGPSLGEEYVVLNGLEEGEEIAVNGTFNIDAAAQLAGKPSMMNPEGGAAMTGHNHGGMDMPKTTSETTGPAPISVEVGEKAKPALDKIYKAYFAFKDALVTDDTGLAKETGTSLQLAIKNTDMSLFSGQAHNVWMKYSTNMLAALEHIAHFQSLDEIRPAFQKTSTEMLALGKSFGPGTYTIYVQHCPMANTNKGADWLSLDKEIKNPYFGAAMLGCGEITSTLK
ncbi:MAG: efflux RND transporter periplasmic adaptor subunit [Cyclobacteriaceae bacterium]